MRNDIQVGQFRLKLYVKDFAKVRSFYENVLQFQVANEWNRTDQDRGVMFVVGDATLEVLPYENEYTAPVGCDVSLEISDIEKLWQELRSKDFITKNLAHNTWGDMSFEVADPEGFRITFFTKD